MSCIIDTIAATGITIIQQNLLSNRKIRKDISGRLDNKTLKSDKKTHKISSHDPEKQNKQKETIRIII